MAKSFSFVVPSRQEAEGPNGALPGSLQMLTVFAHAAICAHSLF